MPVTIKRAVKHASKLRMAIMGPSGSGKTFTSLLVASALAGDEKWLVIDTERGSATKYADYFTFDVIDLETFSPESYIEAIHAAEDGEYRVLVIDSISHEWAGPGGVLEIVDGVARRNKGGNSFAAWGEVTPRHNKFVDAITSAKLHVIVTMRSKQEYALDKDERTGKTSPRKVGMAPIQRDLFEYEMDVVGEMDIENVMTITKSRCSTLASAVISKPGAPLAATLTTWLRGDGSDTDDAREAVTPTGTAQRPQQPQHPQQPQRATQAKRGSAPQAAQIPPVAQPQDELPKWGELGAEAKALGLDTTEWQRTITAVTGKARTTDPQSGEIVSLAAQLTDADKRKMLAWLEKRRQQFTAPEAPVEYDLSEAFPADQQRGA